MKSPRIGSLVLVAVSIFSTASVLASPRLSISGRGEWVCVAEDTFENLPVIARGATQTEAKAYAMQQCAETSKRGDAFFCKIEDCEYDRTAGNAPGEKNVTIVRERGSVFINVSGEVVHTCVVTETFKRMPYVAKAPTRLEAAALARRACVEEPGNNGKFCELDRCEAQSTGRGGSGRISGGLLRHIFGGRR